MSAKSIPGVELDSYDTSTAPAKRRARTPLLMVTIAGVAASAFAVQYVRGMGFETTDDAQVEGRIVTVSSRVAGQILRVRVSDNQLVNAGDVLLELDPQDYAAKLDAARADLEAARAMVDGARSALAISEKTAPSNLTQARGAVTTAASSMSSARATLARARAELAAARSRDSLAELNFRRARELLAHGALPQTELDARRTEVDRTQADFEQSRALVVAARAGLMGLNGGLVLAKGRLDAADTQAEQLASARAALALAEARAHQARAALKVAELNLSYTTVVAPRRGVVSRRTVEAGHVHVGVNQTS